MKTLDIFLFTLLCLSATPTLAQINIGSIAAPELAIELKTEFPKPGEILTGLQITLRS